ncbi:MAG: DUF4175 family protein [Alphaproteobacteria bacterium]|nr:DUF4175 family protein [Alphaproteobacteria bacterium]
MVNIFFQPSFLRRIAVYGLVLAVFVAMGWSFDLRYQADETGGVREIEGAPPHVAVTMAPVLTEKKTLLLAYEASDETGIREMAIRITPRTSLPGASLNKVELPLPVPSAKKIARTDSYDVMALPWSGEKVSIAIVATNEVGKKQATEDYDVVLPERRFFHPIARVLIEERKKLLENPDDDVLREEVANIMASVAHDPTNYRNDPVVLMALRGGAVRLVLGRDVEAVRSVNDILWHSATRIENGAPRVSQRTM